LKIALKYGLLITFCFIIWVTIAHWLFPDPRSLAHSAGAAVFVNIVEIICITLGIRARKNANGGRLLFKDGLKTGLGVAAVYGLSACVFFVIALMTMGTRMLAVEPGSELKPLWQVALGAFLGLFGGAMLMGLLYSTVVSFFLASKRSDSR
jgi:hypothetical protein